MKITAYAAAISLMAGTAFAGGLADPVVEPVIVEPVAPVAVSDWTGFYAGLQFGQGEVSTAASEATLDFDAYGLHAGYLYDFGQFVAGAEIDYNELDAGFETTADMLRLRGRLGYDLGRFLPYATLGAARMSSGDVAETGVTYGLGADFKVTERISLGAEYSWNQFDIDIPDGEVEANYDFLQLRAAFRF